MNSRSILSGALCALMLTTTVRAQTVRSLNLLANRIIYEPVSGKIYATVPSKAATHRNSVATIDPVNATVSRYVFIGNEPNPLAASDDGQFLYVGLDGPGAIRRYTIATHTAGLQFSPGNIYSAVDLKVLPGAPHSLAVSRGFSGALGTTDVAIFDDGVQRPNIANGSMDCLAFSKSAAVLYAQDTGDSGGFFYTLAINSKGVSVSNRISRLWGDFGGPIVFDPRTGLVFDTNSGAVNPKTSALVGAFSQARRAYTYAGNPAGVVGGVVPDTANHRVFFLIYDQNHQETSVVVEAFDLATFMPTGSLVIPNVLLASDYSSYAADLVPWGNDGLVFRTSEGQLWFVNGRTFTGLADFQLDATNVIGGATVTGTVTLNRAAPAGGAVIFFSTDNSGFVIPPPSVTIPAGQTSASFSMLTNSGVKQDVIVTATYGAESINRSLQVVSSATTSVYPANIRVLHLTTNDLVFNPLDKLIYASVPSNEIGFGNSITALDPASGTFGASVFVGSEPTRLAISSDGSFIYAGLNGAAAIRRFDPSTHTAELQYSLGNEPLYGPYYPAKLVVLPGEPHALAISRSRPGISTSFDGIPIYDDAVPRPKVYTGYPDAESITAGASAGRLYGYDNESSGFQFIRFNIDASGITLRDSTSNLISDYYTEITYQGGLVFASNGTVIHAEARTLAGIFSGLGYETVVLPDLPDGRVYFVDTSDFHNFVLRLYDPKTFLQIAAFSLPGLQGKPSSLVKWKTDNIAFRTDSGQLFLVNAALPTLSTFTIAPSTIVGGKRASGTVRLSNVAPVGGGRVTLVSSNPTVASVPSSVTVPAGSQERSFSVTTSKVSSKTIVTVTANYTSTVKSTTITVTP